MLAGCSGGGAGRSGDQLGAPAARQAISSGGTLRLGVAGVASLDPALANAASASQTLVADLFFDGLTAYDTASGRVIGAIASGWSVGGDGRTWTFHLDPNARFSDGQPITAAAVKASLERVMALGVKSVSGLRLAVVDGYAEVSAGQARAARGVVAVDAATLQIQLTKPLAALPELLADPSLGIVAGDVDSGVAPAAQIPVTSGPFAIDSRSVALVAASRAPGSDARLDRVEVHLYPDATAAYDAFAAGEVDQSVIPADRAPEVAGVAGASVVTSPHQVSLFYGMNVASSALSSVSLRQAIVKAVDRDALRAKFFGDAADTMNGLIGPGVSAHRDNACGTACAYDPDGAKALIASAFPNGAALPTVHLDYFEEPTGREAGIANAIAEYLRATGIPAEPRGHSFDEYQRVPTSGTAELFRFGWIGSYPSPDAYLTSLFESNGADNAFGVADAMLDTDLAAARIAVDDGQRTTNYLAAEDRVFALAVVLPIAQYRVQFAVSSKVRDLVLAPNGSFDIANVWVADS